MPRPQPENFKNGAKYRWSHKAWKCRHDGSLIGNATVAGGITGSQVAVVVFILLAVVVTLARWH